MSRERIEVLDTGFDWSAFLDVAGGVAAFLCGLGVFIATIALARTLGRLNRTLDGIDEQINALGKPVSETLAHVGGIADTADQALARISGAVASLEQIASSLAQTVKSTQETVSSITAGIRRFFRGDAEQGERV